MPFFVKGAGFTLIEMLVALTMLSLLSVGVLTTFRFGQRAYAQVVANRDASSSVGAAQQFLRQALESAYPFALGTGQVRFGFEGAADAVEFTAQSPQAARIGHYRYAVVLRARDDGAFDLVVRSAVDRHGFPLQRAAVREELLVERVAAVYWSYLGAADAQWRTRWAEQRVPALIRLDVAFPRGDSRLWPELVVATRITDDAQCEFDVVAQACREGT